MLKRPIFIGIIVFALSAMGWVFSIVINVITLGHFRELSNVLGYIFLLSLPVAILAEIVRWFIRRRKS